MGKNCGSKCSETASYDLSGRKQMVAQYGNKKYPAGQVHPQCSECLNEMIEHGRLMILFDNDEKLVKQYEEMMKSKK